MLVEAVFLGSEANPTFVIERATREWWALYPGNSALPKLVVCVLRSQYQGVDDFEVTDRNPSGDWRFVCRGGPELEPVLKLAASILLRGKVTCLRVVEHATGYES